MKAKLLAIACVLMIILTGCTNGPSTPTSTTAPTQTAEKTTGNTPTTATKPADATPPAVSSVSPVDRTENVLVNVPVTVKFSEEMQASTLNTTSFTVSSINGPVDGKITASGNSATFTPAGELAYSTSYTVTISNQAADLAGNGLPTDYTCSFKTRDAGILEDALNYTGKYPAPALVSYTDISKRSVTVTAYPGQVQVYYDPTVNPSQVEAMLISKGGTVLGKIPLAGYYLMQVTAGGEAAYITSLQSDTKLKMAIPNIVLSLESDGVPVNEDFVTSSKPVPLNITGPVLVDAGEHASALMDYAKNNGGEIKLANVSSVLDSSFGADKVTMALTAIAQGSAIYNPGKPAYINLSNGAGAKINQDWVDYKTLDPAKQQVASDSWKAAMLGKLQIVDSLPADLGSHNLVIAQSAGNSNMPIGEPLQQIRNEYPDLGTKLRDNVTIYSSDQSAGNVDQTRYPSGKTANYAPEDKDVVKVNSPVVGTSSLWSLIGLLDTINSARDSGVVTPAMVNAAVKIAALSNPQRQLDLKEATDTGKKIKQITENLKSRGASEDDVKIAMYLAQDINAYRDLVPEEAFQTFEMMESLTDTDPTMAWWVTGITINVQNGVSVTGTITPAVAGVTVQLNVKSNLGRNITINGKTDASGRATFSVPAGDCEETYTYTVTAILSNKSAKAAFMFYYD